MKSKVSFFEKALKLHKNLCVCMHGCGWVHVCVFFCFVWVWVYVCVGVCVRNVGN